MTLTAPVRVKVVPVAASAALRSLQEGGPVAGALLGAGAHAAWARVGEEVVLLGLPGEVRFPNGVELPGSLLGALAVGDDCAAGEGVLSVGEWRLRAGRWWDPHPALPRIDPALLVRRAASLRGSFPAADDGGLGQALAASDPAAVLEVARRLIGNGPGLTPLGDDVLAGALATARLLGEAAGHHTLPGLVAALAPALCGLARESTTGLSATLLRHATRGEVDGASAALLMALSGRGDLGAALARLLAVGHTSGRGLATGLLAGAAAAGGVS